MTRLRAAAARSGPVLSSAGRRKSYVVVPSATTTPLTPSGAGAPPGTVTAGSGAVLDGVVVLVVVNAGMVSVGVVGLPTTRIPARPTAPSNRNTARNGQME